MKVQYLIIGAGPTGLAAGYRLKELGQDDFMIVDADSVVGGLSKSIVDANGFTWDIGGHVQFSHYPYFDALMAKAIPKNNWLYHERESWVWIFDRFIPYPLQNNLHRLPREYLWKCLEELLENSKRPKVIASPRNFREWMHSKFGSTLVEVFFEPYNFKVWATHPDQMSFQWVGERVSVMEVKKVLRNLIYNDDDITWGPNSRFGFPQRGGTGAIWESVANLVGRQKIRLQSRVASIDPKKKEAKFFDGNTIRFDQVLSTIPLNKLVETVHPIKEKMAALVRQLRYSSTNVVGIGVEGQLPPHLQKKCWVYFPEGNCPFYRATVFSNYSPQNVPHPDRQYSLMFEVSESDQKTVNRDQIVEDVIRGAKATGILGASARLCTKWYFRVEQGYPVPTVGRDAILATVIPYLDNLGLFSRGRFGGWRYEVSNQDHSAMQGVEWADRMISGSRESTYFGESSVNQHKKLRVAK